MVSKSKSFSKSINNDNITIDAKHSEMINHFKDLNNSIPKLKEELKKYILEYNTKDLTRKCDIEYIIYKDKLKEQINDLKTKIDNIVNCDEVNKYYMDVGVLLHSYYENIENSKNNETDYEKFEENLLNYDDVEEDLIEDESVSDVKKENYKSVVNFFNDRENEDISLLNEEEDPKNIPSSNYTSLKISDFVKEESTFKKKNVLEEYLQKIDSTYISKIKIDLNIFKCPNCHLEMTVFPSDGIQICEKCGLQQNVLIESDKPSFKDPPMEVCYFSYKRINHYNELLYNLFIKVVCFDILY